MEEKVIDTEKVEAAIKGVCDLYDAMGLTLLERWHVSKSIEMAALGIIGENYKGSIEELRDKLEGAGIGA